MPRIKELKIDPSWSERTLRRKQRDAAEEACRRLLVMMDLGLIAVPEDVGTEEDRREWREFLCKGGGLGQFSDIMFYRRDREAA